MARFSGRQLGAFGATGAGLNILTWEQGWMPGADPDSAARGLVRVENYLNSTLIPLEVCKEIGQRDTQEHFDSETDPQGYQWEPLDPDYLDFKTNEGFPADILHRTGELETKATGDAWKVADDTLLFDSGDLPAYGLLHQAGGGDPDNIGVAAAHRAKVRAGTRVNAKGGLGLGRGSALPMRRFIGISEAAELEMLEAFETWFDNAASGFGDEPVIEPTPRYAGTIPPGVSITHRGVGQQVRLSGVDPSGRKFSGRFGPIFLGYF